MGPEDCSRYSDLLRAGWSGDRILVEGEIFRPRPSRPWGPFSLLCTGCQISFLGVKRRVRSVDHSTPSKCGGWRKSRAVPLLPLWAFVACDRVNCTFTFWVVFSLRCYWQGHQLCNLLVLASGPIAEHSRMWDLKYTPYLCQQTMCKYCGRVLGSDSYIHSH